MVHATAQRFMRATQKHMRSRMCTRLEEIATLTPTMRHRTEETPNRQLGYKLGAVSITMYINSHTSF